MTIMITATTIRTWMSPLVTWNAKRPRAQQIKRMIPIVNSIVSSWGAGIARSVPRFERAVASSGQGNTRGRVPLFACLDTAMPSVTAYLDRPGLSRHLGRAGRLAGKLRSLSRICRGRPDLGQKDVPHIGPLWLQA